MSILTSGESVPVLKKPGDPIFSATLNTNGMVLAVVTNVPGENVVDTISRELEATQLTKASIEGVVDKISHYFVIGVVIAAFLVFGLWVLLVETGVVPLTDSSSSIPFAMNFGLVLLSSDNEGIVMMM